MPFSAPQLHGAERVATPCARIAFPERIPTAERRTCPPLEREKRRPPALPACGARALLETIGIVGDRCAPVDRVRRDRIEVARMGADEDHPVDRSLQDAASLIDGVDLTETMSMGLPWFEQVVMAATPVREALYEPWTDAG